MPSIAPLYFSTGFYGATALKMCFNLNSNQKLLPCIHYHNYYQVPIESGMAVTLNSSWMPRGNRCLPSFLVTNLTIHSTVNRRYPLPFLVSSLTLPYGAVTGATARRFRSRSCTRSFTKLYSSRILQALESLSLKCTRAMWHKYTTMYHKPDDDY